MAHNNKTVTQTHYIKLTKNKKSMRELEGISKEAYTIERRLYRNIDAIRGDMQGCDHGKDLLYMEDDIKFHMKDLDRAIIEQQDALKRENRNLNNESDDIEMTYRKNIRDLERRD